MLVYLVLAADRTKVEHIRALAQAEADVVRAGSPMTMHFGPEDVLLNLDVQFRAGLSSAELARTVDRLEKRIRAEHPEIKRIFIEAKGLIQGERAG